jgi:hypothetical protein
LKKESQAAREWLHLPNVFWTQDNFSFIFLLSFQQGVLEPSWDQLEPDLEFPSDDGPSKATMLTPFLYGVLFAWGMAHLETKEYLIFNNKRPSRASWKRGFLQ